MQRTKSTKKSLNSKGASIFKKMLEDKKAIEQYIKKGGKLKDLKQHRFVKPLSSSGK